MINKCTFQNSLKILSLFKVKLFVLPKTTLIFSKFLVKKVENSYFAGWEIQSINVKVSIDHVPVGASLSRESIRYSCFDVGKSHCDYAFLSALNGDN